MHILSSMRIKANRDDVLQTLRANRSQHATIVKEAREGYVKHAQALLQARLAQIAHGEIVDLTFKATPPRDHTKVYNTAIKMLEMHTAETIDLDSAQVRNLIQDEWDWMESFLRENAAYSATSRNVAALRLDGGSDE